MWVVVIEQRNVVEVNDITGKGPCNNAVVFTINRDRVADIVTIAAGRLNPEGRAVRTVLRDKGVGAGGIIIGHQNAVKGSGFRLKLSSNVTVAEGIHCDGKALIATR